MLIYVYVNYKYIKMIKNTYDINKNFIKIIFI